MMGPRPGRAGSNVSPFLGLSARRGKISLGYNLSMVRAYFPVLLFLAMAGLLSGMPVSGFCAQAVRPIPTARNFGLRSMNRPLRLNSLPASPLPARLFSRHVTPKAAGISALVPGKTLSPSLYSDMGAEAAAIQDNSLGALLRDKKSLAFSSEDAMVMSDGGIWSKGSSIMDRVLGAKSMESSGDVIAPDFAVQNRRALPAGRGRNFAHARLGGMPLPQANRDPIAGGAVLFGLATAGLSEVLAALNPAAIIAGYFTMILPSLILHEMAHAKAAEILGDPSPRLEGRLEWSWAGLKTHVHPVASVALPLLSLLSPFGLLAMARPVEPNGNNFRHPIYGMAKTALAGPAANAALAVLGAAIFGGLSAAGISGAAADAARLFTFFNVTLAMINLVPLFPMDGHHVLSAGLHRISPALRARVREIFGGLGLFAAVPLFIFFLAFGKYFRQGAEAIAGGLLHAAAAAFGFLF